MLEAQNRRIDDLMERIRQQQEKLDKQNVRIRTLQSQVRKQLQFAITRFVIMIALTCVYCLQLNLKSHL